MGEFKGTPGPWEAAGLGYDAVGTDFETEGYKPICHRPSHTGGKLTNEYDANMQLIAAAPELLEALRQLHDYVEDVCGVSAEDCDEGHPLTLASSAIAKALGETKRTW